MFEEEKYEVGYIKFIKKNLLDVRFRSSKGEKTETQKINAVLDITIRY